MNLFNQKILQLGLALVVGLCLLYEANFTQTLAGQDIDVYVAYSGRDKKDKRALKKAFPANQSVKINNVDLLALADYSGKQKAIAKLEKAKVMAYCIHFFKVKTNKIGEYKLNKTIKGKSKHIGIYGPYPTFNVNNYTPKGNGVMEDESMLFRLPPNVSTPVVSCNITQQDMEKTSRL